MAAGEREPPRCVYRWRGKDQHLLIFITILERGCLRVDFIKKNLIMKLFESNFVYLNTASLCALKIRIIALTRLTWVWAKKIIQSGITTVVLTATNSSHSRMRSPFALRLCCSHGEVESILYPREQGLALWRTLTSRYGGVMLSKFWNLGLEKLCSFHFCPPGMPCHEEAWDERSWGDRGPAVSAIPAEPSPQHTHGWMLLHEWAQAKKQQKNHIAKRIMKNNKTINHCLKPLSLEVICHIAVDNHACLVICNRYNHIRLRGNLLIQQVSELWLN